MSETVLIVAVLFVLCVAVSVLSYLHWAISRRVTKAFEHAFSDYNELWKTTNELCEYVKELPKGHNSIVFKNATMTIQPSNVIHEDKFDGTDGSRWEINDDDDTDLEPDE